MTDITVPQLGESVTEATVGSWMVKTGDAVSRDDVLVELETDKVAVEVRAEADGVMGEIFAAEGENVEIGARLAVIEATGSKAEAATEAPATIDDAAPAKAEAAPSDDDSAPSKEPAPSSNGTSVDATVPQMGESVTEGTIGSWLVKAGDTVEVEISKIGTLVNKIVAE